MLGFVFVAAGMHRQPTKSGSWRDFDQIMTCKTRSTSELVSLQRGSGVFGESREKLEDWLDLIICNSSGDQC